MCEKSPAKKSAKKKEAPIISSKKGSKQSPLKIESEDEEDETIEQISKSPPKSNGKKPPKRQREEESESEYDYGDSDEEESDEEPRAKKSRMNTPPKKLTKSPAADLNDTLKCPSCGRTFKSKLGLKGHVGKYSFVTVHFLLMVLHLTLIWYIISLSRKERLHSVKGET